jgi:hypothetical protein
MKIIRKNAEEWKLVPVLIEDESVILKLLDAGISRGNQLRFLKREDGRKITFSFKGLKMEFSVSEDPHYQLEIIKRIGRYKDPYDFVFLDKEKIGGATAMIIAGGICSTCRRPLSNYSSLMYGSCRYCASRCNHVYTLADEHFCQLCGWPKGGGYSPGQDGTV